MRGLEITVNVTVFVNNMDNKCMNSQCVFVCVVFLRQKKLFFLCLGCLDEHKLIQSCSATVPTFRGHMYMFHILRFPKNVFPLHAYYFRRRVFTAFFWLQEKCTAFPLDVTTL
jgi:hypothetical protein